MPSAQEKKPIAPQPQEISKLRPCRQWVPISLFYSQSSKADEQYSSRNADSRGRSVFLGRCLFCWKPPQRPGGQALPAVWPAGWHPSSLAKNHFCKEPQTNPPGLPLLSPCQQPVPAQDETKRQHPRIFHRREINTFFLVTFSHNLYMLYCFFT